MLQENSCIICHKIAKLVLEDFDGYAEDQKFNIYYCPSCNTSFVWPHQVSQDIYNHIYSQASVIPGYNRYALYAHEIQSKKKPLDYLATKEAVYYAVRETLSDTKDKTIKILEVGSGLGYLTYAIAKEGYDIKGIDISDDAVKKATNRFGNYYICHDVYHFAASNSERFDLIILTEVIEHVPDADSFCDILINLLKDNGKLLISTPNKSAHPPNVYWYTELPPVHLTWFSEQTFKEISEQKNLSVSFFDFTKFNMKHLDFTKFKYYDWYIKRHPILPTIDKTGIVLKPSSLREENVFKKLILFFKAFFKLILERIIIKSPLVNKNHFGRSTFLVVILQKYK
jgi:2-polyprenyl-3-methyl-5-hydroxy-6-metoxy-1,4-benzoquinol methylase